LVEFLDAEKVYKNLVSHKIIIRNRAHLVPNTLRITVGTKDENKKLIEVLQYLESIQ
jgi:histidinol-phosphate aminotransferase